MPVERGQGGRLPRWISDPHAGDFADPDLVAWEVADPNLTPPDCPSWTAVTRSHHRFLHALDEWFGKDQWPTELARQPACTGPPPADGGPPAELRAQVVAWQSEHDAMHRATIRHNWGDYAEEMRQKTHTPPATLPDPAHRGDD